MILTDEFFPGKFLTTSFSPSTQNVCILCLHACMSARLVEWGAFFLENSNLIRSVVNTLCWILWTTLSGWHLHEKWVLWVNYRSHWSLKSIPVSGKTNELKTLRFCVTFVQAIIHVSARPGSRPKLSSIYVVHHPKKDYASWSEYGRNLLIFCARSSLNSQSSSILRELKVLRCRCETCYIITLQIPIFPFMCQFSLFSSSQDTSM